MAIETVNSFHAAATVAVDNSGVPNFVHGANQGFAAFGTDPATSSVRVSKGRFRLRLLAPVNLLAGEGIAWGTPLAAGFFPEDHQGPQEVFVGFDLTDNVSVLDVQTQRDGKDDDLTFFSVVVLRLGQQSSPGARQ
jgi:hypothetical protein